jgi:mannose-1-phosphate guanylyltransferase
VSDPVGDAHAPGLKLLLFCGGSGTRLWPMSRVSKPKQFQQLVGEQSLFQLMVGRLAAGFGIENVFVSTGEVYRSLVLEQAPDLPPDNVIAEPEMRDTLAAVGFAITVLNHRFPGCTVATLWGADHVIRRDDLFLSALRAASHLAQSKGLVVEIDVPPTYANTSLGYIEIGDKIGRVDDFDVHAFVRQVEKPDLQTAESFLRDPKYLWHTGYAVWTTTRILDLYRQHAPDVAERLRRIDAALGTVQEDETIRAEFRGIEKLSVDYGLFQKMGGNEFAVISVDLGWSDIGAWDVLRDELVADSGANVTNGCHIEIETTNSLVYGPPDKTIVTIGVDNLIVVDTGDALLVCRADRAQDVKKVVEKLKREGYPLV